MDEDNRITIAHWSAKPGDPNAPPMTLEECIAQMRAENEEMLKNLFAQIQAYVELGASRGVRH